MKKSPEAFRTISEVADWLDVPTHVLRFWESRFAQVKPVKRAGGRRYYRPSDMRVIGGIKTLLHDQGMTIRGVQKLLREEGVKHVSGFSRPLDSEAERDAPITVDAVAEPMEAAEVVPISSAIPTPEEPTTPPKPARDGVPTFGSVRRADAEPAVAEQSDAQQMDLIEEIERAEASAPEPHEAAVQPDPEPAAIPATPGVPDSDAEDDSPEHVTGPGLIARLIARERTLPVGDPTSIETAVSRLRAVRGKTGS